MLERTAAYRDEFAYDDDRPGLIGRALRAVLHHPGRTLATLIFVGGAGAIVANAAFFQTGEHPSPFFSTRENVASPPAATQAPPADTPAPAAATPPADEIARLVEVAAVGAPTVQAMPASANVVEVQQLLLAQGYDPGVVDGLFGARTRRAIQAYQTAWGVAATGEITEALLVQLRSTAPNPASPAVVMPTAEVRLLAIQTALNQIGYGPIAANGEMTAETTAAVRAFQLEYGLTPTGTVDQALIARMVAIGALEPF